MKKTVIVNIYNFIRKSHEEPSRFIQDDFDTIQKQIQVVRQYGLPATYALKYDALTDGRYQKLLRENTDPQDEISAWWEITRELCEKAGVRFRGKVTEEFDERVNSAYSIGYEPEERRRLVDAYMDTFREVFGRYPQSIGSWVLDTVTLEYAARKYGITAGATCRDQIGTDGFTLWGGYPNGVYYPSRLNENLPSQAVENQLPVPVFRRADGTRIEMEHEGFAYHLTVERGTVTKAGAEGVCIAPVDGKISLRLADAAPAGPLYTPQYLQDPAPLDRVGTAWKPTDRIPPFPPEMCPAACIFPSGTQAEVTLHTRQEGVVRYTTDGSVPDEHAPVYTGPITLREDTELSVRLFLPDGRCSEVARARYRFVLTEMELQSHTRFDPRAVFSRGGIRGLLAPRRGSCDYLCGEWLGTLQDLDVTAVLPHPREIESIGLGFLSHHRSGIVFPEYIELFTGPDAANLTLKVTLRLPCAPCEREIVKKDFVFPVGETLGSFRVVAHRYARMPAWCAYKGVPDVFTMADTLLVKPKDP